MKAVRLDSRLRRLEAAVPTGCPVCCERRGRELLHVRRQNPDGTCSSLTGDPQPCERCGEVTEEVIEIIEVLVLTHEEWEQFQDDRQCKPATPQRTRRHGARG
jgi:hypothetical protein